MKVTSMLALKWMIQHRTDRFSRENHSFLDNNKDNNTTIATMCRNWDGATWYLLCYLTYFILQYNKRSYRHSWRDAMVLFNEISTPEIAPDCIFQLFRHFNHFSTFLSRYIYHLQGCRNLESFMLDLSTLVSRRTGNAKCQLRQNCTSISSSSKSMWRRRT